jgi:pSer/pThr/pTyr-binding forkhead associated (FHA) protein
MRTAPPALVATPKSIANGMLIVEESRDGSMVGKTVRIDQFPFQMGRLTRDLNFNDDRNVSRNHAHITRNDMGEFYIEDQGSTLHTFVNDVEIPPYNPVKLNDNSVVCLGTTTVLTFYLEN